jgi:hypothetical protein
MGVGDLNEVQQLWEWREKIANLYYEVRSSSDAVAAWELWRNTRSAGRVYTGGVKESASRMAPHRKHASEEPQASHRDEARAEQSARNPGDLSRRQATAYPRRQ